MGAKGVKRPDLPCERSPPGGSSSLRSTAAKASQQTTRAIAALTRRMHRMPISCQRGQGVTGGMHKNVAGGATACCGVAAMVQVSVQTAQVTTQMVQVSVPTAQV